MILAPLPGIKPAPPTLEGEVLSTGPQESPQISQFWTYSFKHGELNSPNLIPHYELEMFK